MIFLLFFEDRVQDVPTQWKHPFLDEVLSENNPGNMISLSRKCFHASP